jgi:hypothetical protein
MRVTSLLLLLILASVPAVAVQPQQAGRYVFVPVEAGSLRLDTATGEVSLCTGAGAEAACRRVRDDARDATDSTAAVDERLAALEARVEALETRSQADLLLSDEESVDRVMLLAERMMRHFFGIVREMKREMEGEEL